MDNKPNFELPRSLEDLRMDKTAIRRIIDSKTEVLDFPPITTESIKRANYLFGRKVKYLVSIFADHGSTLEKINERFYSSLDKLEEAITKLQEKPPNGDLIPNYYFTIQKLYSANKSGEDNGE